MPYPVASRDRGKEMSQELSERHTHGRYGSGLDDQKKGPSVKEAPQRPKGFAQINVLTAGPGHHGSQFAIAESAHNSHESGNQPGAYQQGGRIGLPGNVRRDNKDARANHGA